MLIFNKVDYKNDSLFSNLSKVVFKVNDIFKTNPNCNYSKNLINTKALTSRKQNKEVTVFKV